jgi:RimJ/RimL family protein N-acetyltransferase
MAGMTLPTPTLHTARLRLRPFGEADADDLFALHSNANVLRYWDAPPWSERARPSISSRLAGRWQRGARALDWPWTVSPTGRSSAGAA